MSKWSFPYFYMGEPFVNIYQVTTIKKINPWSISLAHMRRRMSLFSPNNDKRVFFILAYAPSIMKLPTTWVSSKTRDDPHTKNKLYPISKNKKKLHVNIFELAICNKRRTAIKMKLLFLYWSKLSIFIMKCNFITYNYFISMPAK